MRRVLSPSSVQDSWMAPAAAMMVREANDPVLSGEAPVSPVCTVTAS